MRVLDSNQLSPGPRVTEFERLFAFEHGGKYGVMVNSGTDALRIALGAMKEVHRWHDGDKVLVPALTFVATLNVVLQNNLRPVLVDIDPFDYGFNREQLFWGNNAEAKCVMPVHLFGRPTSLTGHIHPGSVLSQARLFKIKVLEDSCECMGISKVAGDIACYSMYVCHLINTGVGGVAVTKDKRYAEIMRSLANHGRATDHIPGYRLSKDITRRFVFDRIGYSSRPTEIEAALGIEQLKRLPAFVERRQQVALRMIEKMSEIDDVYRYFRFAFKEEVPLSSWMMFPVVVQPWANIDKWDLCKFLEKNGIETREMLPLTNQPCYKELKINPKDYPQADLVNRNGFYVGCHPGMTNQDADHIAETFRRYLQDR